MGKILVVDDEKAIRSAIHEFAEFLGYEVKEAGDGMEAVRICREEDFDVIIMDIMMPKLDGFSAYQEIKKQKDIPVLMLSAKGQEYDKLYGFELGIDDYMVKPFSIKELMARVRVIISRHTKSQEESKGRNERTLLFQGLEIHGASRKVFVDGEAVSLRPKEFDLLYFLAKNEDIVFSRNDLLEKVWGYSYVGDDRTVDTQIKMIRHALGPYRNFIVTYRGVGYKFESEK